MEALEDRHVLSTITVTTIDDVVDLNDGETSLREAIDAASPTGNDTINFSTNPSDSLNGGTIALDAAFGEIAFSKSLTIDASGLSQGLTISAAGADPTPSQNNGDGIRIFNITGSSPSVMLKNLTPTGGDVSGGGGAIAIGIGGTSPNGSLTLQDCTISGNASNLDGGGVYFNGKNLNVLSTTFHDNHANVYSSNGGELIQCALVLGIRGRRFRTRGRSPSIQRHRSGARPIRTWRQKSRTLRIYELRPIAAGHAPRATAAAVVRCADISGNAVISSWPAAERLAAA
jgi:hypothetical protein